MGLGLLFYILLGFRYSPLRNSDPSISTVSSEWPDRIANMAPHVHPEKFWVETLEDHTKDPQTATKITRK